MWAVHAVMLWYYPGKTVTVQDLGSKNAVKGVTYDEDGMFM